MALTFSPSLLTGDDFGFHELGARAAALGGAFTARADDASALFYNPAGLAFLKGVRFKTNLTFADRTIDAAWPGGDPSYHSSPNEIQGAHVLAWQPFGRLTLSTGIFSPYTYQSLWYPSFGADSDCSQNRVRTLYFRSVLAVEVFEGFAVSGGVDIVSSALGWKHNFPLNQYSYAESRHELRGRGLGFVAGILWKIIPAVQVGASYQQDVTIDYAGGNIRVVYYAGSSGVLPNSYGGTLRASGPSNIFVSQDVTGRLTLPRKLAFGVVITPFSRLSFNVDVQRDRWRDFGHWIFWPTVEGSWPYYGTEGVALGLTDTTKLKAGLEFRPARYLALRAGYAHHQSSVDAAHRTLVYPDLERNVYSLGFGYEGPLFSVYGGDERVSDLSFDLFVRYAAAVPGASTYPGYEMTYESRRFVFGVGVGFSF